MSFLRFLSFILLLFLCTPSGFASRVHSFNVTSAGDSLSFVSVPDAPPVREHRWLFGLLGSHNVLDTYLSPFEYTGLGFGVLHRTEKPMRRHPAWSSVLQINSNIAYVKSPTDNTHELDMQLNIGYGFLHSWRPLQRLRLSAGGMLSANGGFTYNTRGGNNPAQGRLAAEAVFLGVCEYGFGLFGKDLKARLQADIPVCGLAFSPSYGQSYYEIFSLGHTEHNLYFTHPFNVPSARILCSLDFPVRRAVLSIGYHGDVRQSKLGGLKHHVWNNFLVIGFTRRVQKVR